MGIKEQLGKVSSGHALFNYFDYPRSYQILGSRGCPFNCTFCYHILGESSYRQRSIKNLIEEIKYAINHYKINHFSLNDDMFAFDKKRLSEFCGEIKKIIEQLSWELKWDYQMAVTHVDEKTLKLLKDSGCHYIGFGFESYSPQVLRSMRKPITPEMIDNAIKLSFKLKMPVVANFIFGDVAETKETANETLNYWKSNCQGQVKLFFIHPYPGSKIFHHCIKKGIIKDKLNYIKNKIHHTNILNMTDSMSDEEFKWLIDQVWKNTIKYSCYVSPIEIHQNKNFKERIDARVKCPFCECIFTYKNLYYQNRYLYNSRVICRNKDCNMLFFIASKPYILTIKYYRQFDFLRKNFLLLKDKILKMRV